MREFQTASPHTALSLIAALAASVLVTGCGKTLQATTTTKTAVAAPVAVASTTRVMPASRADVATAAGPGLVDDTSQTAALSAPANSNGTTPAKGVTLPPSR